MEAVVVMVLHRHRPHLLYLSLIKEQPELSKDTFEVSLFISRKKSMLLVSLHSTHNSYYHQNGCGVSENMHQCLRDGTCP